MAKVVCGAVPTEEAEPPIESERLAGRLGVDIVVERMKER